MDKVICINKPTGMTSHDVVYKVRKILKTKKVGHTGTLDPDACGVLPICVGRATKISDLILNKDKTYICTMTLGTETDTYDASGKVISVKPLDGIDSKKIQEALFSMIGDIQQIPPAYSAIKVNGKKLYELARKGQIENVEIKPREVTIREIEIIDIDIPDVKFSVTCSKGTYIRSICHDVGIALGTGAHMSYLQRTASGIFTLDKSITIEELEEYAEKGVLEEHSYSVEDVLGQFEAVYLAENAVKYYMNGGSIDSRRIKSKKKLAELERVRVYKPDGTFIGSGKVFQKDGDCFLKSEKIFNME